MASKKTTDSTIEDIKDLTSLRHKVFTITKSQFLEPIKYEYAKSILRLSPAELYDNYNPGPAHPDGSPNFECHCMSHLVASPCGHLFRNLYTCQRSATDQQLEDGVCNEEIIAFLSCAGKAQCFRTRDNDNDKEEGEEIGKSLGEKD